MRRLASRAMEPRPADLDPLLRPRVIAVAGASRDPAKWGRRILTYTSRAGFAGALYGVNPMVDDLGLPGVTTVAKPAATRLIGGAFACRYFSNRSTPLARNPSDVRVHANDVRSGCNPGGTACAVLVNRSSPW